jgi:hypothetical protein
MNHTRLDVQSRVVGPGGEPQNLSLALQTKENSPPPPPKKKKKAPPPTKTKIKKGKPQKKK